MAASTLLLAPQRLVAATLGTLEISEHALMVPEQRRDRDDALAHFSYRLYRTCAQDRLVLHPMSVTRHELLGVGPLGATYRATVDGGLIGGRACAVKVLRPSLAADARFVKRIANAAQYCAALEGPSFAVVQDFRIEKLDGSLDARDQPMLVCDLVDGVDLERLVEVVRARDETMPPVASLTVLADLAAALAALHRRADLVGQGVCQLALWPAKILIRDDGRAMLSAPGLLMSQPPEFFAQLPPEQRWFVAPEIMDGQVTPAADAWSLGRVWSWLVGDATLALWPELASVAARLTSSEPSRRGDLEHASARLLQRLADFGSEGRHALARYVRRYHSRATDLYLPDPDDVAAAAERIDEGPTQPFTRAQDSQPNRM
jgi:serine/threonine protein kinase